MLLSDNRLVHTSGDEVDKVAFAGNEVVEFSDINRFAHSLSGEK